MRPLRCTLVSPFVTFLSSLPIAAQTTHVVDVLGGPGVFTTLGAAVQAAVDGDTILVRPTGAYDFTVTTAKGLTIRGAGPGPTTFFGRLVVDGLPAARTFGLRNVQAQAGGDGSLGFYRCTGAVVLEDVIALGSQTSAWGWALGLLDSPQVSAHHVVALGNPGISISTSTVAAAGCTFASATGAGCAVQGGRAHLTECTMAGAGLGLELSPWNGVAADVTLAGGLVTPLTAAGAGAMLWQGSTVRLDAAAVVLGTTSGTFQPHETGRVRLTLAPAGAQGSATYDGAPGAFGALALGLPVAPLATGLGDLWIDPLAFVVVGAGAVPLQASIAVPSAAVVGQPLVAQGVLLHQGALVLSGPVRALVP